jgi:predicted ABC-class ATPase
VEPERGKLMGLLEDIRNENTQQKPCKVARHLAAMEKNDAKDLQAALDDRTIPIAHIETVLNRHGFPVGHSSLDKHRKGLCCCVSR